MVYKSRGQLFAPVHSDEASAMALRQKVFEVARENLALVVLDLVGPRAPELVELDNLGPDGLRIGLVFLRGRAFVRGLGGVLADA